MLLSGKDNATVKRYTALKTAKGRAEQGLFLLEGERLVSDSIKAGAQIEAVFLREGHNQITNYKLQITNELGNSAQSNQNNNFQLSTFNFQPGAAVYAVAAPLFSKLCDTVTPQNIVAVAAVPPEKPYGGGDALILDGVRDPGNLGTLIRSAAGFNFREIYLLDCADPYNPKAVRASMSAVFHVNIHIQEAAQFNDEVQGIRYKVQGKGQDKEIPLLRGGREADGVGNIGLTLLAADMDGENLNNYTRPDGPIGLIIGGEARGVTPEVLKLADRVLSIRTEKIESLNAATAGSIMMYALSRKS